MKIKKMIRTLALIVTVFTAGNLHAGKAVVASGEASEEVARSLISLASASGDLSAASIHLGGEVVIALGRPVASVILESAEVSMDVVSFSSEVLIDGLLTSAQLSADLTLAGVEFSADATTLVANAAAKGIHISADTAEIFLDQAINIAAAGGRLSGETAELVLALAAAGVELSADSVQLSADATRAGVELSEEAANKVITACLTVASESMEAAVVTERYMLMTLEEANRLLYETSVATVAAGKRAGRETYAFTIETAGKLKSLGIDSAKYAEELTVRAAHATKNSVAVSIQGTNDAIVVIINTGSGLIVASLDSLTSTVQATTNTIKQ